MKARLFLILVCCAGFSLNVRAQEGPADPWKPFDYREHLTTMYEGADLKYAFDKYKPSRWRKWQKDLRKELTVALGLDIIERNCRGFKPSARQLETEDLGGFTRERWEIRTEPDVLLPMVILRPKRMEGRVPLMITPHGHYKNTEVYAGVYSDEQERARIAETECDFAIQAVQHGFIAIAPTTRGFGKTRTKDDIAHDRIYSCGDLMLRDALVGRTPIGDRVWDMMRILDWALEALPVDEKNVIVCGNSGGGTVSLYTGALDTRFSQSVPADYLCGFEESLGLIRHCACNYVPGVMRLCDMGEIGALTAPRPFCAINGAQDEIFPVEGTRRVFATVEKVYQAAGVPDNCMLYAGPGGHRFFKEPAWDFILSHLTGGYKGPVFDLDEHIGICGYDYAPAALSCGLDYLEANVSAFLVPEQPDSVFAARRQGAGSAGLPVYSANGFFPPDILVVGPEADLERAGRYAETAIRRAAEAGLKILVLGSSRSRNIPEGFSREEAEGQFLSLLKGMAPAAEKYGVIVAIEPLQQSETNFINTVKEGAEMARRAGSPNIAVIADFFHMAREGEPPTDIIEAADKLVHCHIAECAQRTPPGVDGDDFTPYYQAFKQIGYQGRISIECGWKDINKQLPVAFQSMKEQIQTIK